MRMRAKRAIPAAQKPRRVARLAQILRYAKNASLRMTSTFSHYRPASYLGRTVMWTLLHVTESGIC